MLKSIKFKGKQPTAHTQVRKPMVQGQLRISLGSWKLSVYAGAFHFTDLAADRFLTFIPLWFSLCFPSRGHEHRPEKFPNIDSRNSRGHRPQEVETSMRRLCPKFHSPDNMNLRNLHRSTLSILVPLDDEGPGACLRITDSPVTPSLVEPLCV